MIDMDMYVGCLNGSLFKKSNKMTSRAFVRGFLDIEYDLITQAQLNRPFTSVCELGIGGSGKQKLWKMCGADVVVGVDIIDPNNTDVWANYIETDYVLAMKNLQPGIEYFWNSSSYSTETPRKIGKVFDIVLDDSDTGEIWSKNKGKRDVIAVWKDWISKDGLFISETVNGQDQSGPMPLEYHMKAFEVLAGTGMVIFDTSRFKNPMDTNMIGNQCTTYHLGVWAPNWEIYKPVIEKYKECVVAGYENIG